jgi:hypothetical protein
MPTVSETPWPANENPWHDLPEEPLFVLPDEKEAIEEFNREQKRRPKPNLLNLNVLPAPFVGRWDAPVLLLGNIAGWLEREPEDYAVTPACTARMRGNLVHAPSDFPFFPLDPGPDVYPTHEQWWSFRLRYLLQDIARQDLARSILAVECFPYRSSSNEYAHDSLHLESQEYSRRLVRTAMNRNAVIVVRYGWRRWCEAVTGLDRYRQCLRLKGQRRTHISPKGFVDRDGYDKVVDKIRASLTE